MTGIDTNVLVRYLTRDHTEQYEAAKQHLEANCTEENPGYINVIVLCELVWVLTRAYDANSEEIVRIVDQILRTRQLHVERRDQVRSALTKHAESGTGFADCLIGELNQHAGVDETVTFDQRAAQFSRWRELDWSPSR